MSAAHEVADHVLSQSDTIATNKVKPGAIGWLNLLKHVGLYHVVMLTMLLIVIALFSLPVSLVGIFSALLFSAVTHAALDRRWPVKLILDLTGSKQFAKMTHPLCGMYLADQSLHKICLWVAALLFALL